MTNQSKVGNSLKPAHQVAIIGGGLAGLSCARELIAESVSVHLFEKAEEVGGRMATTTILVGGSSTDEKETPLLFDHGAQYFTARSPEFLKQVDQWKKLHVVQPWQGPFVSLTQGDCGSAFGSDIRYVGCPGMDALCMNLEELCFSANHLQAKILKQANVLQLQRERQGWRIFYEQTQKRDENKEATVTSEEAFFETVILAVPSSQVPMLLPSNSTLLEQAKQIEMAPCLAVLLSFQESLSLPYAGVFVQGSPLRWISNNSSMPGRKKFPECWILHPCSEWSAEHWGEEDEKIIEQIGQAFEEATGTHLPNPISKTVTRWRDAIPTNPSSQGYFSDPDQHMILCGDWCNEARVEGAYLSGFKAARHFIEKTG